MWRRPLASVLAMVLATGFAATSLTAIQQAVAPTPARADSGVPVTSADGRIQLTKTASTATVPPQGASVTYTYTVTNTAAVNEYYAAFTDDKCGTPDYVSGMQTDGYGKSYLAPGASATFTCSQLVTQTTTNTATFTAKDYNAMYLGAGVTSTASAQATVSVNNPTGYDCNTLWWSSMGRSSTDPGRIGTFDAVTGAATSVATLPSITIGTTTYNQSTGLAVSPTNPNLLYTTYVNYAGGLAGRLASYDATTGTWNTTVSSNVAWSSNRLAADPSGLIWSMTPNGHVYSYDPATGTVLDHGIPKASNGINLGSYANGDIAFDGLGNMWILASNGTTNYLFTVAAADLAAGTATAGPPAQLVGVMNRPVSTAGTYYDGIAFGADGTLYATSTNGSSISAINTVNKDTGATTLVSVQSTAINAVGDAASCAGPKPQLVVTKTVDQATADVGGALHYTITIKNIGNLSATGVKFSDQTPADTTYVSSTLNGNAVGSAGANYWATPMPVNGSTTTEAGVIPAGGTATITMQVQINNPVTSGATQVCNQGSTTFIGSSALLSDDPAMPTAADPTCTALLKPEINVTKSADPTTLQGSGPVTYTYVVTNPGNETLSNVTLTDDKCPNPVLQPANPNATPATGDLNGDGALQVGETWKYTCTQSLSATTTNTATATAQGALTGLGVSSEAQATVAVQPAAINIAKSAGQVTGPDASGRFTVVYTVTAQNTGNGTGSYGPILDVTQFATNAIATDATWSGAQSGSAQLAGVATTAADGTALPPYSFQLGAGGTLAPGATDTYSVTVGFHYANASAPTACAGPGTGLYNSVSATGETGATADNAACIAPPPLPTKSLSISKSAAQTSYSAAGTTINYSFQVTNTGQVSVTGVAVSDAFTTGGSGVLSPISCADTTLAPGQSTTCTATYVTTQADVDAASVANTAFATGTSVDLGTTVVSPPAQATVGADTNPAITLTKTAGTPTDVNADGLVDAGDTVVYSFDVTNTGNVTLNRPAAGWIADPLLGAAGISCPGTATQLAPGAAISCTSTPYTITAADVAAGSVSNTATATGNPVTATAPVTATSSAVVATTAPAPALAITKAASTDTFAVGTQVTYTFQVTNTGNVPVSALTVTDAFTSGGTGPQTAVTCAATTLAVGAATSCSMTYTADQADVDAGALTNAATVTGQVPAGDGPAPTAGSNQVTLTTTQSPALTVKKSVAAVTDVNANGITDAGDTITWNFTVRNTGNVTLTRPADGWITDDHLGPNAAITCPSSGPEVQELAPGASVQCSAAPYTITAAEAESGSVTNVATASATVPNGTPLTSPPDQTTTTTMVPAPSLALVKTATVTAPDGTVRPDGVAHAGDTVTFSYAVTNTGNVTLDAVAIAEDDFTGSNSTTGTAAPTVSCPPDPLAAGATVTCTATFAVDQNTIDYAAATTPSRIRNTAHAVGTPQGSATPSQSNQSTVWVPTAATASLSLTKTVVDTTSGSATGPVNIGDTLTYSFVVTNTGDVTLNSGTLLDTFTQGGTGAASAVTCDTWQAAPGGQAHCTMTYVVSAQDLNGTSIDNRAQASATTPSGRTVTSNQPTASIATDQQPALSVAKTVNRVRDDNADGITDAGDTVTWSILVTNTGNVDLDPVTVSDPLLDAAGVSVTCPQTALAAGAATTCSTGTYTITAADVAAGQVANTATATGTVPATHTTVTGSDTSVVTTTAPAPAVTLTKTPAVTTFAAGDLITYTLHVTNTGNVPLGQLAVTDAWTAGGDGVTGPISCPATTLAPGAAMDCTLTYVATQADVDTGHVDNTATVTGTSPTGTPVTTTASASVTAPSQPGLAFTKLQDNSRYVDANHDGLVDAGDTIAWSFIITNTGNVTVHNLHIADAMLRDAGQDMTYNCPYPDTQDDWSIAPGETVVCYSSNYTITAADQAAGSVTNTAATYAWLPNQPWDNTQPHVGTVWSEPSTTVQPLQAPNPQLTLTKTVSRATFAPGDTVTYTFHVANPGNVTISALTLNDAFTSGGTGTAGPITCPATSLAPGGAMDCTMTYVANQADADAGTVTNSATVTGTAPSGDSITPPAATATMTDAPRPSLTLAKSIDAARSVDVNGNGITDAGDTIVYTFAVTNTGNVTLGSVQIADSVLAGANPAVTVTCPAAPLGPQQSTTCIAQPYTITAADQAAGSVANTATAQATTPAGTQVTSPPASALQPVQTPNPHVSVEKLASDPTFSLGQPVLYTFVITNDGNETLHILSLTDQFSSGGEKDPRQVVDCSRTTVAVNESITCTLLYTPTQDDVDGGTLQNQATVVATPEGSSTQISSQSNVVTLTTPQGPALTVAKSVSVDDANADGLTDAGDIASYTFTVTNTGNVTLAEPGGVPGGWVTDPTLAGLGITWSCTDGRGGAEITTLAPNQSVTCTAAPYLITAADEAAGSITNTATAHGTSPEGEDTVSPPSSVVTQFTPAAPALSLTKSVTSAAGATSLVVGDTLTYHFAVTNTGNVALHDLAVSDQFTRGGSAGLSAITCPTSSLAVGASTECTATYQVNQADVDAGSIANTATATALPPGSTTPVTANSNAQFPGDQTTSLALTKRVQAVTDTNGNGITDAGDTVTWSFDVTNHSNVTVTALAVSDPTLAAAGVAITCPTTPVAPGATVQCTSAAYSLTQDDVNAGGISNTATATALPPNSTTPVTSNDSTARVDIPIAGALALDKQVRSVTDSNGDQITDAGDQISWEFVVTNRSNVTVTDVAIADDLLAPLGIAATCPPGPLLPGARVTCVADPYPISAEEAAAGAVVNTATASATTPTGSSLTSNQSQTVTQTQVAQPGIALVKAVASNSGATALVAGDTLTYSFVVSNTGNVPLTGLSVADAFTEGGAAGLSGLTCPPSVAPGTQVVCTATYTVTQADVDAGHVANTATVTGHSGDTAVTSTEAHATFPGDQTTSLALTKRVKAVTDAGGDGITDAGDQITWTFDVTNHGNVTLTNVGITDPLLAAANVAITCPAASLAPEATVQCTSAPYTITAADQANGSVANVATAQGTPPPVDGTAQPPVTSNPSPTTTPLTTPAPGLRIAKHAAVQDSNGNGRADLGEAVRYTFTVTNTGNTTLTAVTVSDPLLGLEAAPCTDTLAPGASADCTVQRDYRITQADVDAGEVVNVATAAATVPGGATVTAPPSEVHTPTNSTSALTLTKNVTAVSDTNGDGITDVGDQITYSFTVLNAGTQNVSGVAVSDDLLQRAGIAVTCPPGDVEPGRAVTCTAAPYTIAAADVVAGAVTNTATASATTPAGTTIRSNSDSRSVSVVAPSAQLSLSKTVANADGSAVAKAGDTLRYTFRVTNTGNVAVTGLTIADAFTQGGAAGTGPISCEQTTLAPGATTTCTVGYAVTQADVDAGGIANTATASGSYLDNGTSVAVTSNRDSAFMPTPVAAPAVAIAKNAAVTDANRDGLTDAGDTVAYTFTVTNVGNVDLTGVTVSDRMLAAAGRAVTCQATQLAPGASTQCTAASYTITAADQAAGGITNVATASATPPPTPTNPTPQPVTSPPVTKTVAVATPAPALTLSKLVSEPGGDGLAQAGETLSYTFTVTNAGNVAVSGVMIDDTFTAGGAGGLAGPVTCAATQLAPGASTTCHATYVVTAADLSVGRVSNQATATATPASGGTVTSGRSTASIPTEVAPVQALALVKDGAVQGHAGPAVAGDQVVYTFTVTNTGTVALHGVRIDDAKLAAAGVTITCRATDLAAGAATTCTSSPYTVTAADAAAGSVMNTATAQGMGPGQATVTSPASEHVVPVVKPTPTPTPTPSPTPTPTPTPSPTTPAPTPTPAPSTPAPTSPPAPTQPGASHGGVARTGGPGLPLAGLAALVCGTLVVIRRRR